MKKMGILGVLVSAVLFLPMPALSQFMPKHGEDPMQVWLSDPIGTTLRAYDEANNEFRELENPSPVARLAHYKKWEKRFQEAITQHPESMFLWEAKVKLLGLHNGLEKFDLSQELLQDLIATSRRPEDKIRWQNELGIVSRARYWTSQDQSELEKAQAAFDQADELYRSLPPEKQDGPLGGQRIVSSCIAAVAAREAKDHEKAATQFRSARELFQSSTESAMFAASAGYDLEIITEQEMLEWIQVKKETDALKCLEILSEGQPRRWVPSYYALHYATLWYESNSKGFQNFASSWLDKNTFDERTPIFMACLGFSYFDDGLHEKALPIYETLRDKHRGDFQRLEPKAFQQGNGGHYERVLADLVKIYSQRKEVGKVESLMTELTTLLPDSSRAKMLKCLNPSLDESEWIPPERAQNLGFRIFCAVMGMALILLGIYLAWRKNV